LDEGVIFRENPGRAPLLALQGKVLSNLVKFSPAHDMRRPKC
jgi:hypothetical protein